MKKEDLINIGIEDEDLQNKIFALYGKDIEKHKTAAETAKAAADQAAIQLAEANAAIEGFKAMDIDGIKLAADDWKTKAEAAQAEAEKAIQKVKFDASLNSALKAAKARNLTSVKALLKTDEITLDEDETLKGLDEQLETIKSENEFLFEQDEEMPRIIARSHNNSIMADPFTSAIRKGAGLTKD